MRCSVSPVRSSPATFSASVGPRDVSACPCSSLHGHACPRALTHDSIIPLQHLQCGEERRHQHVARRFARVHVVGSREALHTAGAPSKVSPGCKTHPFIAGGCPRAAHLAGWAAHQNAHHAVAPPARRMACALVLQGCQEVADVLAKDLGAWRVFGNTLQSQLPADRAGAHSSRRTWVACTVHVQRFWHQVHGSALGDRHAGSLHLLHKPQGKAPQPAAGGWGWLSASQAPGWPRCRRCTGRACRCCRLSVASRRRCCCC